MERSRRHGMVVAKAVVANDRAIRSEVISTKSRQPTCKRLIQRWFFGLFPNCRLTRNLRSKRAPSRAIAEALNRSGHNVHRTDRKMDKWRKSVESCGAGKRDESSIC